VSLYVALLLAQLGVGGAERQFAELAAGLTERGHRVRFLTLFGGGRLVHELEARAGIVAEPLRVDRPRHATLCLPGLRRTLARLLAADPPDVLYAGDYAGNLLAAGAAPRRVPVVWGIRTRGSNLSLALRLLRRAARPLRGRVALAVSNSAAGLAYHRELGCLPRDSVVIPNGVDVQRFRPAESDTERAELRGSLGLDSGRLWAGIIARFDPMKDHATFFAAARHAAARRDELSFVVAAPDLDAVPAPLRSGAGPLGERVRFVAAGDDSAPLHRSLDVLVSSSVAEGFPNVIVEAMASGVPCAVTDAGDSRLAVGDTGRVAPTGDGAALGEAILALVAPGAPERRAQGARARERVLSEFTLERMVERSEDALRAVAAGERSSPGVET